MADDLPDAPWTKAPAPSQDNASVEAPWTRAAPDAAPAEAEKPEPTWGETGKDVVKSGGVGIAKGLIGAAGLPGDLQSAAESSWNPFTHLTKAYEGANPERAALNRKNANAVGLGEGMTGETRLPTSQGIQSAIESKTGEFYKPQTTAGEYAQTAGEFLPNAAMGPGGVMRRVGANVLLPAAASETAGQLTKGTAAEPYARLAGAVAAPLAASTAARAITPLPLAAERQALNQTLRNEGVTAQTAGQAAGSHALGYIESTLGDFPGAGGLTTHAQDSALRQYTQAALRRIGMHGEPTRANVDEAVQGIQDSFNNLSARNTLRTDRQFGHDIGTVLNGYEYRVLPSERRVAIDNIVNDIVDHAVVNSGSMNGTLYQSTRSALGRDAKAFTTSEPPYAQALRGIRNALDDAMNRSISPSDRAQWATARERWANWKTLERAAGNVDELGNVRITPTQLAQSAAARNRGQFARGNAEFNDLADAGKPVLKALPQSGTAPRAFITGLTTALGSGVANVPGALAGLAAPAAAGRTIMSPPIQRYLKNQVAGRVPFGSPQQVAGRGVLANAQVQDALKTADEISE